MVFDLHLDTSFYTGQQLILIHMSSTENTCMSKGYTRALANMDPAEPATAIPHGGRICSLALDIFLVL